MVNTPLSATKCALLPCSSSMFPSPAYYTQRMGLGPPGSTCIDTDPDSWARHQCVLSNSALAVSERGFLLTRVRRPNGFVLASCANSRGCPIHKTPQDLRYLGALRSFTIDFGRQLFSPRRIIPSMTVSAPDTSKRPCPKPLDQRAMIFITCFTPPQLYSGLMMLWPCYMVHVCAHTTLCVCVFRLECEP